MKNIGRILIGLLILGCFAFTVQGNSKDKKITVVIDLAHGGEDPGFVFNGVSEKELVQSIGNKIKTLNNDSQLLISFTREIDKTVSLSDRVTSIKYHKPDLVLSLHVNSHKDITVSGMELFVSKASENYESSKRYAQNLKKSFISKNPFQKAKIKEANFHIFKNSIAPAIALELGYLTNYADRAILTNEDEQTRIAETILQFLTHMKYE